MALLINSSQVIIRVLEDIFQELYLSYFSINSLTILFTTWKRSRTDPPIKRINVGDRASGHCMAQLMGSIIIIIIHYHYQIIMEVYTFMSIKLGDILL